MFPYWCQVCDKYHYTQCEKLETYKEKSLPKLEWHEYVGDDYPAYRNDDRGFGS